MIKNDEYCTRIKRLEVNDSDLKSAYIDIFIKALIFIHPVHFYISIKMHFLTLLLHFSIFVK